FNDRASTPATGFYAPTAAGLEQIANLPGVSSYAVSLLRERLTLAPAADAAATANFGTLFGTSGIPFGVVRPAVPSGSTDTLAQVSVDHLPDAANQFRYRFNSERIRAEQAGIGGAGFNNLKAYDMRLFSATWVRALGSNMVNDLRLAYRRVTENHPLKDAALNDFPNIVTPAFAFGPKDSLPQGSPVNNNYQIYNALSYARGAHNFKFGGEFRRLIYSTNYVQFSRGYYEYADLEQFFTDSAPSTQIRGVGQTTFSGNNYKFYGFAQDDWKVTPALTLNLGLRYEYVQIPRDAALQALNSISSIPGVIEFNVPKADGNNIAPRVGFAYSPDYEGGVLGLLFGRRGQSAIRGNFSVSYGEVFGNLPLLTLPPQFQQELRPPSVPGFNTSPGFLQRGGLPATPVPPATAAAARAASSSFTTDFIQPETYSWVLSMQRELTPTMALELRYLGTRGRHLPVQIWFNAAIPPPLTIPTFFSQP
ncbi:MAG: TonB-dependent receptor domain-containing protein, partial [Pyrinomonadaceae bacterium]